MPCGQDVMLFHYETHTENCIDCVRQLLRESQATIRDMRKKTLSDSERHMKTVERSQQTIQRLTNEAAESRSTITRLSEELTRLRDGGVGTKRRMM